MLERRALLRFISPCFKGATKVPPRRVAPDGSMRAITLCPKGVDRVGDQDANA
jgi:hypothetical protein